MKRPTTKNLEIKINFVNLKIDAQDPSIPSNALRVYWHTAGKGEVTGS